MENQWGNIQAFPFPSHYPNVLVFFYLVVVVVVVFSLSSVRLSGCPKGNPLRLVSCYQHQSDQPTNVVVVQPLDEWERRPAQRLELKWTKHQLLGTRRASTITTATTAGDLSQFYRIKQLNWSGTLVALKFFLFI